MWSSAPSWRWNLPTWECFGFWGRRKEGEGLLPKFMPPFQALSGPQDALLWCRSLLILRHDRGRWKVRALTALELKKLLAHLRSSHCKAECLSKNTATIMKPMNVQILGIFYVFQACAHTCDIADGYFVSLVRICSKIFFSAQGLPCGWLLFQGKGVARWPQPCLHYGPSSIPTQAIRKVSDCVCEYSQHGLMPCCLSIMPSCHKWHTSHVV